MPDEDFTPLTDAELANLEKIHGGTNFNIIVLTLIENVRVARAEAEDLKAVRLRSMSYAPGEPMQFEVEHWAVRILCLSLAKSLGDAPNFITMDCGQPDLGDFIVTIQRKHHESPARQLDRLKTQIAALEADKQSAEVRGWNAAMDYIASGQPPVKFNSSLPIEEQLHAG